MLTRQLDEYEARFGRSGPASATEQDAFLVAHPDLQRYHTWYFSTYPDRAAAPFTSTTREHTPSSLLRDPAVLAAYLTSLEK